MRYAILFLTTFPFHLGHLVMISFGGVVGASIWYGTGFAVAYSGPVGALICFFIVGIDVFFVMQCCEFSSTVLEKRTHSDLGSNSGRDVDTIPDSGRFYRTCRPLR